MAMQTKEPTSSSTAAGAFLVIAGLVTLVIAGALYVTEASRAVAVWMSPVGAAALVLGALELRGVAVPRRLLVALGVVVLALVILGAATWIYASAHPPTAA